VDVSTDTNPQAIVVLARCDLDFELKARSVCPAS